MLLNKQWVKVMKKNLEQIFRTNDSRNTTYQTPRDVTKKISKSKFISINAYIRKRNTK